MLERMEKLEEFKRFLGTAAEGYSNAELQELHREMHEMAELLLDIYLYERSRTGKERSGGLLTTKSVPPSMKQRSSETF
jgi:hypothetical protein